MVECTALEMRHTGNRIGGSNPSLSANSNACALWVWVEREANPRFILLLSTVGLTGRPPVLRTWNLRTDAALNLAHGPGFGACREQRPRSVCVVQIIDGADEPYRRATMRCILVSHANLKSDTCCTYCRAKIGDSHARKIGSRLIYCDYDCYQFAIETQVVTLNARVTSMNTWTVNS